MSTSEYLREYLRGSDEEYEKGEPAATPEEKEWFNVVRALEVDSVEGLLPLGLSDLIQRVYSRRDMLEYGLDDHYTRYFLTEIPKIVKRALKLEPMLVENSVEGLTEIYLKEATRAYLFGLFQGSVALTRSSLEQSLKEHLRANAAILAQTDELLSLLKGAELSKLLRGPLLQYAHEVRKGANEVLHGTPCTDQDAFDILIKTRKVIDGLYSSRK